MGPARSSINSTPWGTYSPAATPALVTVQTHKQSLSTRHPFTPGSRESAHTGEVPCPRTQRHIAPAETLNQDLSIQSREP